MNKEIYIHPGFPKTATSFIQRNYFTTSQMINNLGKKKSENDIEKDLMKVFTRIIKQKEIKDDEYLENKKIINSINYIPNKINLISYEGFTQTNFDITTENIFKRIKKLFHECGYKIKIFVTIRSQITMIPSHFANTPKVYEKRAGPRWKYFKNFLSDLENINEIKDIRLLTAYDRYKYFNLLKTLIEIFSEENVKFFLLEDLNKNPKKFFDDLSKFLKIENHSSKIDLILVNVTRKEGNQFKRINKYYFKSSKFLPQLLKNLKPSYKEYLRKFFANIFLDLKYLFDPINLSADQEKVISNYYKEDNELLGQYLKKNLKSLGYYYNS